MEKYVELKNLKGSADLQRWHRSWTFERAGIKINCTFIWKFAWFKQAKKLKSCE